MDRVKVLCVDDNPDTASFAGLLLEGAGYDVRVCHDGAGALALAQTFRPDVCVLDLRMPGMDGDELAGRLIAQADGRPARFIALTGHWDVASQHQTHNTGLEGHLTKPVNAAQLIAADTGRVYAG
jgi:CheY-like chemotaxis protein